MDFNDAKRELKKIADGRYCSVRREDTIFHNIVVKRECGVYLEGYSLYESESYELALDKLKIAMREKIIDKKDDPSGS